mmetsp:Transcript_17575/g.30152  ORF Transcript_17575/g.30152 Transcript_17575/m.30152 type:complete len:287 (-) Transcript_17575:1135-1995(-)
MVLSLWTYTLPAELGAHDVPYVQILHAFPNVQSTTEGWSVASVRPSLQHCSLAADSCLHTGSVALIRQIHCGVHREEGGGLEHEARALRGHHREVLNARDVRDSERIPQHGVCIHEALVLCSPVGEAHTAGGGHHVLARGEALLIVVRGDPHIPGGKVATRTYQAARLSHEGGCWAGYEAVGHWLHRDGVDAGRVLELPHASRHEVHVPPAIIGISEGPFFSAEPVACRVGGAGRQGHHRHLAHHHPSPALWVVNGGVQPGTEHVLMGVCVHSRCYTYAMGGENLP